MLTTPLAFALSIGLLASPAARAEPAPSPPDPSWKGRDYDKPPPGTAADQALWNECSELNRELLIDQYRSAGLEARAKGKELLERLRDPARRGALAADAAEALAGRLQQSWMASFELMRSQWPVSKMRVCQYQLLNFEGVMFSDPSPAKDVQLDDARRDVQDCVRKGQRVHAAMAKANDELEASIDEAERVLPPVVAPATAPAGSAAKN